MKKIFLLIIIVAVVFAPYTSVLAQTIQSSLDNNSKIEGSVVSEDKTDTLPELQEPILDDPIENTPTTEQASPPAESTDSAATTAAGSEYHFSRGPIEQKLNFEADAHTGAFVYRYPLTIPVARGGLQPDLSLTYNSQEKKTDNIFGYGWSVSIPQIHRIQKSGMDKMYTEHIFSSSLSGELVGLVTNTGTGYGTYASRVENGDFLYYQYSSAGWVVTDKRGTRYFFGKDTSGQRGVSGIGVYGWQLQEIRDTNDNFVRYEYYKHQNQIYPSRIIYNGHGIVDGIFEVRFERESRLDNPFTYDKGFEVQTSYRIHEISVWIDGVKTRQYDLDFVVGDNHARSLIGSIIETGYDSQGFGVALPVTTFTYQRNEGGWSSSPSYTIPFPFAQQNGTDFGARLVDANGDGLVDMVWGGFQNGSASNDGNTLISPGGLGTFPFITGVINTLDNGYRFANLNNDRFIDVILSKRDANNNFISETYFGSVTGWRPTAPMNVPYEFVDQVAPQDTGMRVIDMNGDGMADLVRSRVGGIYHRNVYLNNGDNTGWTDVTSLVSFPPGFAFEAGADTVGAGVADINADGLEDLYQRDGNRSSANGIFFNKGDGYGWLSASRYQIPTYIRSFMGNGQSRLVDMNGDGLLDVVFYPQNITEADIYLHRNDGTIGWQLDTRYRLPPGLPNFINSNGADQGVRLVDINGDGMTDVLFRNGNSAVSAVYLSTNKPADLMTQIVYSSGGKTNITYKSSAQYFDENSVLNPNLQSVVQTVSRLDTYDGIGTTSTLQYVYAGGHYFYESNKEKKFAGFQKVTETDTDGVVITKYFHQGDGQDIVNGENIDHRSKIGYLYREQIQNGSGNLEQVNLQQWENFNLGGGRDFVRLMGTIRLDYDGNVTHRDRAEIYTYNNANGNLLSKESLGEVISDLSGGVVDVGQDKYSTTYTYATSSTNPIIQLPATENIINQFGQKEREVRYYYDNLSSGQVDRGNETKVEGWVEGTTYTDTEKVYDPDGFVTMQKDELDHETIFVPDQYRVYPRVVTNALGQSTQFVYNYLVGKPTMITDPNNSISQTIFDPLGRVVAQKQSDANNPLLLVTTTENIYVDSVFPRVVEKRDYLDDNNIVDSYSYLDGLGRPIQERREFEGQNYLAKDYIYNNLGLKEKESLPYFSSGTNLTSPTTNNQILTTYNYDSLKRIFSIVNVVGTQMNAYDNWTVTTTNPLFQVKGLQYDAYGRLVNVNEQNRENNIWQTYATRYEYNGNNNLVKITDANGNVRDFIYDGLGRRTSTTNLHNPMDQNPDRQTFVYDNASNLILHTDGRGVELRMAHDSLNRPLQKRENNTNNILTEYEYDTCQNGIGRVCEVVETGVVSTNFAYDPVGRVSDETKTIVSRLPNITLPNYQTQMSYDRLGNVLSLTYPNLDQMEYTYNFSGQVGSVSRNGSPLVTSYTYNELGQLVSTTYANGVVITNTYDANELYRLRNKRTVDGTQSSLNDFTYVYDAVGNIIGLTETQGTGAPKTKLYVYDDLNRLMNSGILNEPSLTKTYIYDAVGNRLSDTNLLQSSAHIVNTSNELINTSINSGRLVIENIYDNNGSLATSVQSRLGAPLQTVDYSWDVENRLAGITFADNSRPSWLPALPNNTISFFYDEAGNRIVKQSGDNTTYYLKHESTPLYEIDGQGTVVKTMIHNSPSANSGNQITQIDSQGSLTYLHQDHLGSTALVTNSSGEVVSEYDYDEFGGIIGAEELTGTGTDYLFTGQEYDLESDLYYYGARYYNDGAGRFVSVDPVFWEVGTQPKDERGEKNLEKYLSDPQNHNGFIYSRNNPLRYIDPTGESIVDVLRGNQTFGNYQIEIGEGAMHMSPLWQKAMDHPYAAGAIVGVGGGVAAYAGAAGFTYLSTQFFGGVGTVCVAGCQKAAQTLQSTPQALGKIGEQLSGLTKNTERIPSVTNTANYRIPDGLNHITKTLSEVKNVNYQSFTNQLKDLLFHAQSTGYKFEIITRPSTAISGPLQSAINSGSIIHKFLGQ